jgi:UDP-N-acetylmuramoyl-tripeptide--D-alanyl-D-alanine ligase
MYSPKTPIVLVYMLQQVEYNSKDFEAWIKRRPDLRKVMKRKKLVLTKKALILIMIAYISAIVILILLILAVKANQYFIAAFLFLSLPFALEGILFWTCAFGSIALLITRRKLINNAAEKMKQHKAFKIAVLGSYGKTTMKELLLTVLGESKIVSATPGNKNVAISHARWILNKVDGTEEVLIIEYGEYRMGDIAKMAVMTQPDMAVITGIAPNHLENYDSYDALKSDIASIQLFVSPDNVFVNQNTANELNLLTGNYEGLESKNVLGWRIINQDSDLSGVRFVIKKGKDSIKLSSPMLGEHMILPLAFTATLAEQLGIKHEDIIAGIAKTLPYEHRMQPTNINGAIIIDDTYNGSIEGMRAGLRLISQLDAKRKIYVTPGLVEQGIKTEAVHIELGKLIVQAKLDVVVLMQNSVCGFIRKSLEANDFKGELRIEPDPLNFYNNLQYEVAAGDLVLMQNDWTDNYA